MPVRSYWVATLEKVVRPVLSHAAERALRRRMPVGDDRQDRELTSYLEALCRSLAGLSPWLELNEAESQPWAEMAREGLDAISDPASPDRAQFAGNAQGLVEAAFLAQALLRAPRVLWEPLEARVKANVLRGLKESRSITPFVSNWLLFSAMVETALFIFDGRDWREEPVLRAVRAHGLWYKGDGVYGDGPALHADYYNAFVIQPMLLEIFERLGERLELERLCPHIRERAVRYAVQQERSISPEGTFPPVGRSLCYRCGALQDLALIALREELPATVKPAQVRGAMTAVIRRSLEAAGTFDGEGWLRAGFCGAQPGVAEGYISTGSLYLCTAAFLPLGLPKTAAFWADPDEKWTSWRAWNGENFPIDGAIKV